MKSKVKLMIVLEGVGAAAALSVAYLIVWTTLSLVDSMIKVLTIL